MRTLVMLCALLSACGDNPAPGGDDLSAAADLFMPGNLDLGTTCSPTDPMTDNQDCSAGTSVCPVGTIPVNLPAGGCRCLYKCDPGNQGGCPCSRRCVTLTAGDAGVIGGGCFVANGPAERCGADGTGTPFGTGACAQSLHCAGRTNGPAYCLYPCNSQADCPAQTQCGQLTNSGGMPIGLACQYVYGAAGKNPGDPCQPTDACQEGYLCDGTCKPQCNGPGGPCAGGTCTALSDTGQNKVSAWICK